MLRGVPKSSVEATRYPKLHKDTVEFDMLLLPDNAYIKALVKVTT